MGNRWSRSLALARQSVEVLRGNPALMAFPVVSGAVSLSVSASFFLPLAFLYWGHAPERIGPGGYALMAAYYLVSYFVVIFFNVGLAHCTYASLRGERPTFGDGVRFAASRLRTILGWTFLSATVGLVLQFIGERTGLIGRIIVGLLGAAWNIVTYLVVPVLAVEDKGPVAALKESTGLLKRTWGEQLIGEGGVGLVFTMAALLPIAPFILACVTGSAGLIIAAAVLAVLYWVVLAVVASSVAGVYRTALYVYATTGAAPAGFDAGAFGSAFRSKKDGPKGPMNMGRFFKDRF